MNRCSNNNIIRVHPSFKDLLERLAIEEKTSKVEMSRLLAKRVDAVDFYYKKIQANKIKSKNMKKLVGGGIF
jgi:hypothetical protein